MKNIIIALSIALAGCSTLSTPVPAPPLAATTVDEKTFIIALQTFDTTLTAIDRLVAAGVIKPGSPTAIKIADAIQRAKTAFQLASAAQKVGNAANYLDALAQAQLAMSQINSLVKG